MRLCAFALGREPSSLHLSETWRHPLGPCPSCPPGSPGARHDTPHPTTLRAVAARSCQCPRPCPSICAKRVVRRAPKREPVAHGGLCSQSAVSRKRIANRECR
ncbi:hypothetical protein GSI_02079 [Ganoderma sinense ZZ0214-1]|uniref:Uncharacterized protein n=1 Tax=Ganoderma sinense ZZ0214-1 TaxID=1077348 RepID=A0A2G8SNQ4_9APHY|nr:hypothetical protein GSI_02079 [Ganoderma sinense ZZ0214-1]